MTQERLRLGRRGEDAAAEFYRAHGYQVLDRNWRVKEGELDLVCARDGEIVFVEFKTRSSDRFGSGAAAVTPAKQKRIRGLAVLWLRANSQRSRRLRFDVIDVDRNGNIKPYKAAF